MAIKINSNSNKIYSIKDLCNLLDLSRARFYQLLEQQVFPPPIYHIKSKRPLYTPELRDKCLQIKESGIAYNGDFILFYDKNNNKSYPKSKSKKNTKKRKSKINNPKINELKNILKQMGLEPTTDEINTAIQKTYPSGIENIEIGILSRDIFRFLKSHS